LRIDEASWLVEIEVDHSREGPILLPLQGKGDHVGTADGFLVPVVVEIVAD